MQLLFKNSFGFGIDVPSVVREIIGFLKSNPNATYKIIIGTDSARLPTKAADFVTAIVVYRVGNGGRYFWRRFELGKFYTLRDRIIQEVLFSIETAKEVLEELKKNPSLPDWSFEIHADVGENGNTKVLIQEVVGMIRANNFEARTKPESYAASKVADKHVK
ncbi:hypothetical protein COU01_01780 [Candidatus Falkowbacteria bacterium CG10_big_fil_rev_8_21_14_0_10_44_15]|uniref:DUF458 domain-containing protein n=1 Tax=Candidatus Falkowbacteria bacterium CG10_big_fil_rev_8_21_14_0_10_44_15 TaxID=1974569 RepID=A0A2H0V031_9BACT|nr:MAG: hypothetical protein COU01_01780 [Candidatus Falkowbacteria bacterium CG10_big_fil_rev_8_21_14_0_10_44_15]